MSRRIPFPPRSYSSPDDFPSPELSEPVFDDLPEDVQAAINDEYDDAVQYDA